jgi:hypothetical protein
VVPSGARGAPQPAAEPPQTALICTKDRFTKTEISDSKIVTTHERVGSFGTTLHEDASPCIGSDGSRLKVSPTGFAPNRKFPITSIKCTIAGTFSGALDADLQSIVAAWPNLPEAVRAGILAMVRASIRSG